jgi:hypothetical protein
VDASTGVVLRWQQFADLDLQTVVSDVVITSIDYDHSFRDDLFDPHLAWQGGFALDDQAERPEAGATPEPLTWAAPPDLRRPLPYAPPPEGFDPAGSWLTFQYAGESDMRQPMADLTTVPMELFAEGYSLGKLKFGVPWSLACTRSPDGARLAYSLIGDAGGEDEGGVGWLNISEPGKAYRLLPGLHAGRFAFSPDGRQLAVYGSGGEGMPGGVYLADIGSGESKLLLEVAQVSSLAWSPDGRFLALIGLEAGQQDPAMLVVHASTGQEVFRDEDVQAGGKTRPGWPTNEWGVIFPSAPMGGMQECAAPPGA